MEPSLHDHDYEAWSYRQFRLTVEDERDVAIEEEPDMRDLIDIGSDEPNLADVGRPRLVSVKDRNGVILIDAASAFDRARRYDSHRVAARMATSIPPRPRGPMATPMPPARYEVEDFDDLAPFRGIVIAAILAAACLFVAAMYFVR